MSNNHALLLHEASLAIEAHDCININEYFADVWKEAMVDAYTEVMKCTIVPPGGKRKGETLEGFVKRTREIQDKALARYKVAKAELELYNTKLTYLDPN